MLPGNNIGIVILAAGSSSRLGEPKQLLQYDNKNLLQNAIDAAVNSDADHVIVVLGANAEEVYHEIDRSKTHVLVNAEWEEGMASSVRNGMNELLSISPSIAIVILMVCDQPYVSSELLNAIINRYQQTGKKIVACDYGETTGPPALFCKTFFDELMQLKGDAGARKIIRQNDSELITVPFPEGKIDIDTKEDYDALKKL